jgi:hypothetical protein
VTTGGVDGTDNGGRCVVSAGLSGPWSVPVVVEGGERGVGAGGL